MYVYIQSEPSLWTVGFYDPSGKWQSESDHDTADLAAKRISFLNGKEPTYTKSQLFEICGGWTEYILSVSAEKKISVLDLSDLFNDWFDKNS